MAIYFVTAERDDGWHWELVRTLPDGADVVLAGSCGYRDETECRMLTTRIADLLASASVEEQADGSWHWRCRDADGKTITAGGPFHDAAACGHDLARVRMMIGTVGAAPADAPA